VFLAKVLVTGGAGYLGSILAETLLAHGHQVRVLDNFMYGQASLNHLCSNNNLEVIKGDVREVNVLEPVIEDMDYLIPLAAIVGAPACDANRQATVSTNTDAVQILVNMKGTHQRVLFPNTNSGYGIGEKDKACTEETPMKPLTLYGRSKMTAEGIVLDAGNSVVFRLATVFGMSPRMRLDLLVNSLTYRAVKDKSVIIFEGHFVRNYIHVRDVARVFLHAIENFHKMEGQVYNVGLSDANLSKLELCEKIKQYVPDFVFLEAPIGEDPDKRDYLVSNAKIMDTGFYPSFSLPTGITELIKGFSYLKNRNYVNA
jgi:nucleoside-diphosphate-sugar epimerase